MTIGDEVTYRLWTSTTPSTTDGWVTNVFDEDFVLYNSATRMFMLWLPRRNPALTFYRPDCV